MHGRLIVCLLTSMLSLYATVLSTTLFVMLPLRECFEAEEIPEPAAEAEALPGCLALARSFKEL